MIRALGWSSIAASLLIIGYRVGLEVAMYHGTAEALVEAARVRVGHLMGAYP